MRFNMTFYASNTWKGGEKLSTELVCFQPFAEWINVFFTRVKKIGKDYEEFLKNDTELIGQEKANLAASVNEIIGALFFLRRYITEENPHQFASLKNKLNYYFSIQTSQDRWDGNGKFIVTGNLNGSNFGRWYNTVLLVQTRKLLQRYAAASADQEISGDERQEFILFCEGLVNELLGMESQLLCGNINK